MILFLLWCDIADQEVSGCMPTLQRTVMTDIARGGNMSASLYSADIALRVSALHLLHDLANL